MFSNTLTNLGILKKRIPDINFKHLVEECSNISSLSHVKMNTGFNREGMPEHYLVNQCKDFIKSFAIQVANEYIKTYDKALSIKFKTEGRNNIPELDAGDPWINIQHKHQYIPNHDHAGFLSYSLWVKVPEPSRFEFVYSNIIGEINREQLSITKETEGVMIMFPSKLIHCVYPFYNSNDKRISISGNLNIKN